MRRRSSDFSQKIKKLPSGNPDGRVIRFANRLRDDTDVGALPLVADADKLFPLSFAVSINGDNTDHVVVADTQVGDSVAVEVSDLFHGRGNVAETEQLFGSAVFDDPRTDPVAFADEDVVHTVAVEVAGSEDLAAGDLIQRGPEDAAVFLTDPASGVAVAAF